ncbi:hypothetical protein ABIB06_001558 [Bradyrhizobium sp. LB8.2]
MAFCKHTACVSQGTDPFLSGLGWARSRHLGSYMDGAGAV